MKEIDVDEIIFAQEASPEANREYLKMAAKTIKDTSPALHALMERIKKEVAARDVD